MEIQFNRRYGRFDSLHGSSNLIFLHCLDTEDGTFELIKSINIHQHTRRYVPQDSSLRNNTVAVSCLQFHYILYLAPTVQACFCIWRHAVNRAG